MNEVLKNKARDALNISETALYPRVVKGGFWVFSLRLIEQIFAIIRLIILARLLDPHDFGLMGIALLTIATLETFSQTGFQQALIQKKREIESYLNTAWTILILRGVILFTIIFFIAPYATILFNAPEAKLIIQIIGLSFLLQAFTNIGIIFFQKELEFGKQFLYQFSGTFADFVTAIFTALILKNVWALVFGLLAGNLVRFIMSFFIHFYRPHFSLDLEKAKELFSFGKWILGSSILIFLLTQGDSALVGKFLGVTMLGFYQMAYRISNLPATEITHIISQVTFPAYCRIQDNIPRLREAYLKVFGLTTFLSFPIAGLIFILAPDFTKIFLGEKWMPMVPAMQILCIFGVTRAIGATMGPILYSVGRPKIQTKISGIQLIMMAIIIYPLTIQWGILGTSLAVVIPNTLALILMIIETKRLIQCRYKDFFMRMYKVVTGVFMMVFVAFLRHRLLLSNNDIFNFFMTILLCMGVYLVIIYFWDRRSGYKIWDEIEGLFGNLRK